MMAEAAEALRTGLWRNDQGALKAGLFLAHGVAVKLIERGANQR